MASRSISKAEMATTWKPTVTTEAEVVDALGARISLYHPLGEPAVAIRTVADQLKFMATCGAVPPGTYTVRSTNRHAIATKVEVAP